MTGMCSLEVIRIMDRAISPKRLQKEGKIEEAFEYYKNVIKSLLKRGILS
jgi:hypothetical protein